jgi:hypothetical protein
MSREVLGPVPGSDGSDGPTSAVLDLPPAPADPGPTPDEEDRPGPPGRAATGPADATPATLDADLDADGFPSGAAKTAVGARARRLRTLPVAAAVVAALVVGLLGGYHEAERAAARKAQEQARLMLWQDPSSYTGPEVMSDPPRVRVPVLLSSTGGQDVRVDRLDLSWGVAGVVAGDSVVKPGEASAVTLELTVPCSTLLSGGTVNEVAHVDLPDGSPVTVPVSLLDGGMLFSAATQVCTGGSGAGRMQVQDMRARPDGRLEMTVSAEGSGEPLLFDARISTDGADASAWTLESNVPLPVIVADGDKVAITLRLIPHGGCGSSGEAAAMPGFGLVVPRWRPAASSTSAMQDYPDGWQEPSVIAAAAAALALACGSG